MFGRCPCPFVLQLMKGAGVHTTEMVFQSYSIGSVLVLAVSVLRGEFFAALSTIYEVRVYLKPFLTPFFPLLHHCGMHGGSCELCAEYAFAVIDYVGLVITLTRPFCGVPANCLAGWAIGYARPYANVGHNRVRAVLFCNTH